MSSESSTESYPVFAHIGLRENPGKNFNQVTCPDRESNPGHPVSQPDALTRRAIIYGQIIQYVTYRCDLSYVGHSPATAQIIEKAHLRYLFSVICEIFSMNINLEIIGEELVMRHAAEPGVDRFVEKQPKRRCEFHSLEVRTITSLNLSVDEVSKENVCYEEECNEVRIIGVRINEVLRIFLLGYLMTLYQLLGYLASRFPQLYGDLGRNPTRAILFYTLSFDAGCISLLLLLLRSNDTFRIATARFR
ncbi:hypothetical protein ANN_06271 [Periplaneta americana]|uniref:Gustatory receptor n=1 Tax=Periplaneta americana TaxID=6978 RepID=A0ABQ8TD39_PERAM|nr:hypothetical protein ANN_06271 [Periplaneta americana]